MKNEKLPEGLYLNSRGVISTGCDTQMNAWETRYLVDILAGFYWHSGVFPTLIAGGSHPVVALRLPPSIQI
ncbi:MAG: hypothetical protein IJN66_01440 [Muribaculaceae bacterium]|nr:hypothetical protein [Muribaculaceae bacterium]